MLFWILLGIGFIASIGVSITAPDLTEGLFAFCVGLVITVVAVFSICAIVASIANDPTYYSHPDKPRKILALDDHVEKGTDANGAFVLMVGGFSQHEVTEVSYTFYQEAGDETFFLHTLKPDNNTIIHIKLTAPGIPPTAQRFQPNKHELSPSWVAPMDLVIDDPEVTEKWIISVPRGTIINHFKLDAR